MMIIIDIVLEICTKRKRNERRECLGYITVSISFLRRSFTELVHEYNTGSSWSTTPNRTAPSDRNVVVETVGRLESNRRCSSSDHYSQRWSSTEPSRRCNESTVVEAETTISNGRFLDADDEDVFVVSDVDNEDNR